MIELIFFFPYSDLPRSFLIFVCFTHIPRLFTFNDFYAMFSILLPFNVFIILLRCICFLLLSALECMYYNALYKSSYCIVFYHYHYCSVSLTNWVLILQLVIILTLQLLFPKTKFCKTMHPFLKIL